MKKDIKDYLHLYFKINCIVEESESKIFDNGTWWLNQELLGEAMLGVCKVKPILRPLSDMTEEEAVEFIHLKHRSILCNIDRTEITKVIFGETKNIINFYYFRKRGSGTEAGSKTYYVNASDPEQFQFLLSKGFDVYGLIEAGLAIDSTKLPKTDATQTN